MISLSGLQQHLDEWCSLVGVPFVAATVRADGRLLWSGVSGSVEAAPLSPRSQFPIYIPPQSAAGRLSIAVFCNSSLGPNAQACERKLLQAVVVAGQSRC